MAPRGSQQRRWRRLGSLFCAFACRGSGERAEGSVDDLNAEEEWPQRPRGHGVLPEAYPVDFQGCTRFIQELDWNENVTDELFRARFSRATNCFRHHETLAHNEGSSRPSALTGLHVPTIVVPVKAEDLPELPPMYFVLPVWDMVVSNQVRLYGSYDPQELDILLRITPKDSAFVDVGANIGAVAAPMAAHVGLQGVVYAFEPFRQVFQYLNANVATNGLSNVYTYHCALSDRSAEPWVRVPAPTLTAGQNAGMHGVFKADSLKVNEQVSTTRERMEDVEVRTLDSFQLPRVDVIKIDVEGHAPRVLAGAVETLRRHRPLIWFEHDGDLAPEAVRDPTLSYSCAKITDTTEDQYLCGPKETFQALWKKLNGM